MSELKEVYISKSAAATGKAVKEHAFTITPAGFAKDEYDSLRLSLRKFIETLGGAPLRPKLIMTGHQPDFLHPGILIKDILADKIARDMNGSAIHLIVDTDQVGMDFNVPVASNSTLHIERFQFHKREHNIYKYVKTSDDDIQKLEAIRNRINSLQGILQKDTLQKTAAMLDELVHHARNSEYFYQVTETFRKGFILSENIIITDIHLSDLIKSEAFLVFVEKIRQRLPEFRESFNRRVHEYRTLHKIKNSAQPVPDLKPDEMPFWIVDEEGNRHHMMADSPNRNIIPRANTLTMFIRLFLADLFIHGTGGGRYETALDATLQDFFGTAGSPYIVATATMNIEPDSNYHYDLIPKETLLKKAREIEYAPDRFLPPDHFLVQKKKQLILQFDRTEKGQRSLLHQEIIALNREIRLLLAKEDTDIREMLLKYPENQRKKEVFTARNFPAIFYHTAELTNFIKTFVF